MQAELFDLTVTRHVTPRPYQKDFSEAVHAEWAQGRMRTLAVLPTGAGKTVAAGENVAQIIERGDRVLWLAHTRGLVRQARDALHENFGMDGTIEMGSLRAGDCPLVFSTIQTTGNRIAKRVWPRDRWNLLVIDEAHRILSAGYTKTCGYFQCPVLGITATPRRGDQKDLMDFFDGKAIDIPLNRLIKEGYLARLKIVNFPLQIDLTNMKKSFGDFDENEIAHAIEPYLDECAEELAKYKGRKMLVYLPLISTSKKFEALCSDHGLVIAHVDGNTPEHEVKSALESLRDGKIDGVANSMLLTEGIDIPWADLLLNLRPTKSWTLYNQINGRLTRLWEDKKEAIILDPLWLCEDHNMLKRPACLVAKDEEEERGIKGDGDLVDMQDNYAAEREEALRERLERMADRQSQEVDAMEFFLSIGDIDNADYQPVAKWEVENITPGQLRVLTRHNIAIDTIKGKGHASKIIDAIIKTHRDPIRKSLEPHEIRRMQKK